MSKWKLMSLIAGALLIVAFAACSAGRLNTAEPNAANPPNSTGSNNPGAAVGNAAPDFQLSGLNGSQLKLADLHGQPAVLIFWTAWCPVCKEEAPHLNALASKYEPQGVRVIGINIQDSPARTEGGVNEFGIKYRVVRDPDASVTRRYKVTGTPTIIFLDRKGVVRFFDNELPKDYESRLAELIEQKG